MMPVIGLDAAALEVTVNEARDVVLPQPGTHVDRRRGLAQLLGGLSLGSGLAVLLGRADAQGKKQGRGGKKRKAKVGPPGPPGPAGSGTCPSDTTFFASVGCVENAMRPAVSFRDASATCGGIGRRMLTTAELDAYRQQPGVKIGVEPNDYEWSGNKMVNSAIVVEISGVTGDFPITQPVPFRCMTVPSIV